MKIIANKTSLRTIRQGDPKFILVDGMIASPRADFEINHHCPKEYKSIIVECINNGWLKPVATVKDHELFWEELQK